MAFVVTSGIGFAYSQSDTIPVWIKDVALFWATDEINDVEFIQSLQYLINAGILTVPDSKEISNAKKLIDSQASEIESLESDKRKLLVKLQSQKQSVEPKLTERQKEYSEYSQLPEEYIRLLYEPVFVNEVYMPLDDFITIHKNLWNMCESVDYGSLADFLIFKEMMKESTKILKNTLPQPLDDTHYFYYALDDVYHIAGFPSNPVDFKSKYNTFIHNKSMMGLCFEDVYEEFGEFEGMEFGGVGLDEKTPLEVFEMLERRYE